MIGPRVTDDGRKRLLVTGSTGGVQPAENKGGMEPSCVGLHKGGWWKGQVPKGVAVPWPRTPKETMSPVERYSLSNSTVRPLPARVSFNPF